MKCEFKEAWNRHHPDCMEEAVSTVEAHVHGIRLRLALCMEHKEAVLLNASLHAVDISLTDEARHS